MPQERRQGKVMANLQKEAIIKNQSFIKNPIEDKVDSLA